MVLFEIYQRFKVHFLNELRVFFNLQVYNKISKFSYEIFRYLNF